MTNGGCLFLDAACLGLGGREWPAPSSRHACSEQKTQRIASAAHPAPFPVRARASRDLRSHHSETRGEFASPERHADS